MTRDATLVNVRLNLSTSTSIRLTPGETRICTVCEEGRVSSSPSR